MCLLKKPTPYCKQPNMTDFTPMQYYIEKQRNLSMNIWTVYQLLGKDKDRMVSVAKWDIMFLDLCLIRINTHLLLFCIDCIHNDRFIYTLLSILCYVENYIPLGCMLIRYCPLFLWCYFSLVNLIRLIYFILSHWLIDFHIFIITLATSVMG